MDEMTKKRWTREQQSLIIAISLAIALLAGGFLLSISTGDCHWLNRSGAALVASEIFVVVAELRRDSRLMEVLEVNDPKANAFTTQEEAKSRELYRQLLRKKVDQARSHPIILASALAVVGQILHGFGDLILGIFMTCVQH